MFSEEEHDVMDDNEQFTLEQEIDYIKRRELEEIGIIQNMDKIPWYKR